MFLIYPGLSKCFLNMNFYTLFFDNGTIRKVWKGTVPQLTGERGIGISK